MVTIHNVYNSYKLYQTTVIYSISFIIDSFTTQIVLYEVQKVSSPFSIRYSFLS